MVTDIFTTITSAGSAFITFLGSMMSSIADLFYVAEEGFTFFGTFMLIGMAIGIVWKVFGLIRSVINLR